MKTERCMTQTELAERWRISEATLERWRTESGGPLFLKLGNQVRYRLEDVEVDQGVANGASHRTLPRLTQPLPRPTRPVTIWLRTGPRHTGFRPVFAGRQR